MLKFNAMQFLLEVSPTQPIESVAEKLSYGGKMLLVGMGIVFSVLVLLYFMLLAFGAIFSQTKKAGAKQNKVVEQPVPVPEQVVEHVDNDDEIIAVITAAIAAMNSSRPNVKFRVVSFKRK